MRSQIGNLGLTFSVRQVGYADHDLALEKERMLWLGFWNGSEAES